MLGKTKNVRIKKKIEASKRITKVSRTLRFALSDLYNHLVMLESSFGGRVYPIRATFDARNIGEYTHRTAMMRSYNKKFYDYELSSTYPTLFKNEREIRNKKQDEIFDNRQEFLKEKAKL